MKANQNYGRMACDLLFAATALAEILDNFFDIKGERISVDFQSAAKLIRNAQIAANDAANELLLLHSAEGGVL